MFWLLGRFSSVSISSMYKYTHVCNCTNMLENNVCVCMTIQFKLANWKYTEGLCLDYKTYSTHGLLSRPRGTTEWMSCNHSMNCWFRRSWLFTSQLKFEPLMILFGAANFIKVRYKNCDNWLHDEINCSSQKLDR